MSFSNTQSIKKKIQTLHLLVILVGVIVMVTPIDMKVRTILGPLYT
jgi:hypothetical protein